jgi:hypothetical protein
MRWFLPLLLITGCEWWPAPKDNGPREPHGDPDASVALLCNSCTSDQLCIEFFDGTCGFAGVKCVAKTMAACEPSLAACSSECEQAYCKADNDIFGCMYRGGSCNPDPRAFTCYGP